MRQEATNTEKLTDSEIVARLIYRAFVTPDPGGPYQGDDAVLTFNMALGLYARLATAEKSAECAAGIWNPLRDGWIKATDVPAPECDGDSCPVAYPDAESTAPVKGPAFTGGGTNEKREIYAELMAFVASHGLGARRQIAEASQRLECGGRIAALTLSDVQDMTDCKPKPISFWRLAREAMKLIEEEERNGDQ